MNTLHPALAVVEYVGRMWEPDRDIAGARARLIVQRLIETGHLRGKMHIDLPLAADDDVAPGPAEHTGACEPRSEAHRLFVAMMRALRPPPAEPSA
jgi:hypothetical protein